MTEISLKRQARRFAEKHGVSYTRALAAVDEPLHRLKFELATIDPFKHPGFLVTDSAEDILEPPMPATPAEYFRQKVRGTEVTPHAFAPADKELLLEVARRTQALLLSNSSDIWEHRALYRAGLTEENIEPLPHYYKRFGDSESFLRNWRGTSLGVFEVAVLQGRFRKNYDEGRAIPDRQLTALALKKITFEELQALLHP